MLIREAHDTDLFSILEVLKGMDGEEALNLAQALPIWLKMKEYPYYKVFVAEDNEKIIGTCSLIIIENLNHHGARLAVVENMIVSAEYRGCGVGSWMIEFAMERAKDESCYKLMLSSNKKRLAAHRFYEQLGFEQHGSSFMIEVGKND